MISNLKIIGWVVVGIGAIILFLIVGIAGIAWIDRMPLGAATPPDEMNSIEDFQNWKGEEVLGTGSYTDRSTGEQYQVFLAPAGRYLASGPAAYLFDETGIFVEWTPDMGDISTNINGYDLSSGNLERTD